LPLFIEHTTLALLAALPHTLPMKMTSLVCSAIACLSAVAMAANTPTTVAEGTAIGEHIPQFTAEMTSVQGVKPHVSKLDSHKTKRITVYTFIGSTCPATNAYADRFKDLEHRYGPKGVDFIYLYPNRNDTHDVQLSFHKEKGFTGPFIDDHGAHLARLFKARRTTEIFVVNRKGVLVFHGAVDDSRQPKAVTKRYLAPALDEVLAGKPVTTPTSDVFA
jgi:peroxiredoxin